MDLKEINKRFWVPYILVKVNSENRLAVAALKNAFRTGTGIFSTIDYSAQQLKIEHNGDFILLEREKNDEKIINDTGLPPELGGHGKNLAQAQTSQSLQGYNQTTVSYYQLLVRDIWETQWYMPLLMKIIKRRKEMLDSGLIDPIIEEERAIWKEYQDKKESDKRKMVEQLYDQVNKRSMFTGEPSPIQAGQDTASRDTVVDQILEELEDPSDDVPTEVDTINKLSEYAKSEELPCKIKLVLKKKSFDTDLERGTFYTGLLKDEIVTKEFIQEQLGFDDLIQQTKQQEQIDITMARILQDVMSKVAPETGQDPNNPNAPAQGEIGQDQQESEEEGLGNKMGNAFNRKQEGSDRKRGPNIPTTGANN